MGCSNLALTKRKDFKATFFLTFPLALEFKKTQQFSSLFLDLFNKEVKNIDILNQIFAKLCFNGFASNVFVKPRQPAAYYANLFAVKVENAFVSPFFIIKNFF